MSLGQAADSEIDVNETTWRRRNRNSGGLRTEEGGLALGDEHSHEAIFSAAHARTVDLATLS